ncbi:hypothetical protein ABT116_40005, partial [Streptomyces sp. NPDC002130]
MRQPPLAEGTELLQCRRVVRVARDDAGQDLLAVALVGAVECDPSLRTYTYTGRDRRPVGIVGDGTFVT